MEVNVDYARELVRNGADHAVICAFPPERRQTAEARAYWRREYMHDLRSYLGPEFHIHYPKETPHE